MQSLGEKSTLKKLLATIVFHLEPEYLGDEFAKKIDTSAVDKKKLEEYWLLLLSVDQFYKKIQRYEVYFSEFYPITGNIQDYEALDHHISAYLEDLATLQNKVKVFLGVLKNDLKKIASNSKEIEQALSSFIGRINPVFAEVREHRNPLRHRGTKFIDKDLIDVEAFGMLTKEEEPLGKSFKPEFISKLKERKTASFEKAKEKWINLARKNAEQIAGLLEEIFDRNEDFIYQLLKMKSMEDVIEQ